MAWFGKGAERAAAPVLAPVAPAPLAPPRPVGMSAPAEPVCGIDLVHPIKAEAVNSETSDVTRKVQRDVEVGAVYQTYADVPRFLRE